MAISYDWELIEQEYRTGRFTLAQLERRHGVNRSNISRRIKREGWKKDLTERVRERTREKITKAALPPEAELEPYSETDEIVIEWASDENAAVVRGHRKTLDKWRGLASRFAELLESQMAEGKITIKTRDGDTAEIDVPLDYVGKCLGHGTQAVERVVKMERQNYGLDAEADPRTPEERLTDDELEARIEQLSAQVGDEQ